MKAVEVISQHRSREGPGPEVDGKGTREEGLEKSEPVGPVTTSLDVREQGGGLRNRTEVCSLGNYDRSCFVSREVEKPSPEKGLLGQGRGFQLPSSLRQEGLLDRQGQMQMSESSASPWRVNEREGREEKQELGHSLQAQPNLEDLARERCSAQETEQDGQRRIQGGHGPESQDRVRRWDSPAGSGLNGNELVPGTMSFPEVPS